jgi:hypothetical protein
MEVTQMRTTPHGGQPSPGRGEPRRSAARLALAALCGLVATLGSATAAEAETWGSSLASPANVVKTATVDSVYWAAAFANGASATAPFSGDVRSVTVKGRWTGSGSATILFQVLRPQPDGSVKVIATSQPFTMPSTSGTYTFYPTAMSVQQGDYIGLATIGGSFEIASSVPGSKTNDFSGHEQDNNGAIIKPTTVESDVELLLAVDLVAAVTPPPVPTTPPKPEEKKKGPCHCQKLTVKLDPTLINKKHLRPDKHGFGVGFTWRLTCSQGEGGCTGRIVFAPPKIFAGSLPQPSNGLRLNLKVTALECKSACQTSTQGRFEVKVKSRDQLNKMFGRTLAYSLRLTCPGGASSTVRVKVFVDHKGILRLPPPLTHRHGGR